jgi:hypothetical protein
MGERLSQIERDIQRQRSELNDNIQSLRRKAARATDWRCQFEERPLMMMGLAFGGGVLLSTILGGRARRASAAAHGDRSNRVDGWLSGQTTEPVANGQLAAISTDTWDALKSTMIGLATARLASTMEALLPGFEAEYNKAARARPANGS